MLDKFLKILSGMSIGMSFVCLICIAAIKCTELDIKQLEKETVFFNKQTAELAVEAELKKVQYFETLFKVYTSETVKERMDKNNGGKGYYADSLVNLKTRVEYEDKLAYGQVTRIQDKDCLYRFRIDNIIDKAFFYLVEEPEEEKFHPYSDPDEMIEDFKRRYNAYGGWSGKDNPMYNPMIWIKSKNTGFRHLITDYGCGDGGPCNKSCIWIGSFSLGFKELFDKYTYLDGTLCGIEEE